MSKWWFIIIVITSYLFGSCNGYRLTKPIWIKINLHAQEETTVLEALHILMNNTVNQLRVDYKKIVDAELTPKVVEEIQYLIIKNSTTFKNCIPKKSYSYSLKYTPHEKSTIKNAMTQISNNIHTKFSNLSVPCSETSQDVLRGWRELLTDVIEVHHEVEPISETLKLAKSMRIYLEKIFKLCLKINEIVQNDLTPEKWLRLQTKHQLEFTYELLTDKAYIFDIEDEMKPIVDLIEDTMPLLSTSSKNEPKNIDEDTVLKAIDDVYHKLMLMDPDDLMEDINEIIGELEKYRDVCKAMSKIEDDTMTKWKHPLSVFVRKSHRTCHKIFRLIEEISSGLVALKTKILNRKRVTKSSKITNHQKRQKPTLHKMEFYSKNTEKNIMHRMDKELKDLNFIFTHCTQVSSIMHTVLSEVLTVIQDRHNRYKDAIQIFNVSLDSCSTIGALLGNILLEFNQLKTKEVPNNK